MASIDATGLNTANIVDQLMQLEAIPRKRLQIQQAAQESVITTLRGLNTRLAVFESAAKSLATPAKWAALVATSSDPKVAVKISPSATSGQLSVTTEQVARPHQLGFSQPAALSDVVTDATNKVRLDLLDGTVQDIDAGDGTLSSVVAAINNAGAGVTAAAVRTGPGTYQLLVTSDATGAASDFSLTNTDGSALLGGSTARAGSDARISLGTGITVTSASNTFTDLVPGVSITLSDDTVIGSTASVAFKRDDSTAQATIKGFVDQVNGLLDFIAEQTGGIGAKAGKLAGDPTARGLRDQILDSLRVPGGGSLSDLGIQITQFGRLELNETKLSAALAADPVAVQAMFTGAGADNGWATRLSQLAGAASNPTTGSVSTAIKGRESVVTSLGKSIEAWDVRLQMRKSTLSRQYSAMETALNALQNQGNWLAGQLSALNKS